MSEKNENCEKEIDIQRWSVWKLRDLSRDVWHETMQLTIEEIVGKCRHVLKYSRLGIQSVDHGLKEVSEYLRVEGRMGEF